MELLLYQTDDEAISLEVNMDADTVWLSRGQMAQLFDRDVSTIARHITSALNQELDADDTMIKKFPTTADNGATHMVEYFNLDVIISVGYRVHSKRGIAFRKWANSVLKSYIMKGHAINSNRIEQLGEVIRIMKRATSRLDSKQVLDVVERYTVALDMLDDYDHQCLEKPEGNDTTYILSYNECRDVIDKMKYSANSTLFGNEKDDSFKSSISTIYQTFGGIDVYPSLEEKAANLLYLVTKNHSFSDGNKRIAATMFLYFLEKNNMLFVDGEKIIEDYTLVAITIMIAESKPEEKDTMVKLVMNFLNKSVDD